MCLVKFNLFSQMAIPISPRWLGQNKTYRGLFFVPVLTGFGALLTAPLLDRFGSVDQRVCWQFVVHGLVVGTLYIMGELPNSYIKRRLEIAPGSLPSGPAYWLFRILDNADSFIPITLYFGWVYRFTITQHVIAIVSFIVFAECVKKGLVLCRLK